MAACSLYVLLWVSHKVATEKSGISAKGYKEEEELMLVGIAVEKQ